jgi:hypothetical protein
MLNKKNNYLQNKFIKEKMNFPFQMKIEIGNSVRVPALIYIYIYIYIYISK